MASVLCDVIDLGTLVVPCDVDVDEMVIWGEYDAANTEINSSNLTITRRGPRHLQLVDFMRDMKDGESERAVGMMPKKSLGIIEDLLLVGADLKWRHLFKDFPIACLGSWVLIDGRRFYPYLSDWEDEVALDVNFAGFGWPLGCKVIVETD